AGCATDQLAPRGPAGAGMELRARLSTLLGHDQYPGELAGWGPIHAELARDLATTLAHGQWRFAITDEQGQLLHCGITRARPTGSSTRSACSRQIVELQISVAILRDLASGGPDALGAWGPVVTDLAHQHTHAQRPLAEDPTRRFPGAALRRHIEIRDRSCVMIGCRAPAHTADKDHTLDHACDGATTEGNLGNTCRHDHRLKHEGGWRLHQPEPGVFRWTSRLGHIYQLRARPIIESLPDPLPRHGPEAPPLVRPDVDWDESVIWDETPPKAETKPSPRPPPQLDSHDDPPPF
ncbi:MAG: HNH endonuclease signature motif containing protein, partial [Pseudonocardiaceae bacterium]